MVVTKAGLLLPAPFADFLNRKGEQIGWTALAALIGVDEARVRRLSKCEASGTGATGLVSVILVDEWTTRLGSERIADIYGPLYGLSMGERGSPGGPKGDWCGASCSRCGDHLREPAELCGFCVEETTL